MPQQRAEHREHKSGHHEQQIAKHAVGADMTDGFGADHHETADDDDRPSTRKAEPFPEQHGGEQQAAERRAGRLDDAAMTKRHELEADVADERHHGAAQHHQHQSPSPADAAEIVTPARSTSGRNAIPDHK